MIDLVVAAKYLVAAFVFGFIAAGCSLAPPIHIECKGKGTISFSGGPYAGMASGDCGDGFKYIRKRD